MKLFVTHTFACAPDAFWAMFWDPRYDDMLQAGTSVRRDQLEDREVGGIRLMRYRFTPEKPLPGPVARVAGTDRLTYEQENRFDPKTKKLTWRVIPAILPDKVTAEGEFVVRPNGAGCDRVVDGRIEVRVPLVGGRIEQTIVDSVLQAYESAAKVTRDYLASAAKG